MEEGMNQEKEITKGKECKSLERLISIHKEGQVLKSPALLLLADKKKNIARQKYEKIYNVLTRY